MRDEFVPVGGYVNVGGEKMWCMLPPEGTPHCIFCAFEGTQRCRNAHGRMCKAFFREDKRDTIFVYKLNSEEYEKETIRTTKTGTFPIQGV